MGAVWEWRGPQTAFLLSAALGATAALLLMIVVKPPERKPDRQGGLA